MLYFRFNKVVGFPVVSWLPGKTRFPIARPDVERGGVIGKQIIVNLGFYISSKK